MIFNLRAIIDSDSDILYDWVNDPVTRQSSFSTHNIKREEHNKYIEFILRSKTNNQFILDIDNISVGTIKESITENCIELTYAISPKNRGKRIASLMMDLYLYNRRGNFLCQIKESNIPSIKMVKRCGFTLSNKVDGVLNYNIIK